MSIVRTAMITLAALALAAPLLADEPRAGRADLEAARQSVARAADKNDGQAREALLQELRRLDGMIEELEDGKLGRTSRSGPPSVR